MSKLFGKEIPQSLIRAALYYDGTCEAYSASTEVALEGEKTHDGWFTLGENVACFVKLKFGIDDIILRFDVQQPETKQILCSNRNSKRYAAYGFTVYFGGERLIFALGDGENEYQWEYEVKKTEYSAIIKLKKRVNELECSIDSLECKPIKAAERIEQAFFTLDALDFYVGADGCGVKSSFGKVKNFFLLRK